MKTIKSEKDRKVTISISISKEHKAILTKYCDKHYQHISSLFAPKIKEIIKEIEGGKKNARA